MQEIGSSNYSVCNSVEVCGVDECDRSECSVMEGNCWNGGPPEIPEVLSQDDMLDDLLNKRDHITIDSNLAVELCVQVMDKGYPNAWGCG